MTKKELTVSDLKGLKAKEKSYYVWDRGVGLEKGMGSFGVQVTPKKVKRFVFKYLIEGKTNFLALGSYPSVSLADARDKAREYGVMVKQGINLKTHFERIEKAKKETERKEALKGDLKQLFHSYVEQMKRDGKRTHEKTLYDLEKEVYPHIPPTTKAKEVTTHDLKLVLAAMIKRGAVTQSNRVRSKLHAAFNYGIRHDNDPSNMVSGTIFDIPFNPVTNIPKQTHAERVGEHYLTKDEVSILIHDLQHVFDVFAMSHTLRHIILMCFFTGGQRPYELAASKWSAIDFEQKTLLIAPEVSKNKRGHLVPLTDSAIAILERQQIIATGSEFIFPNTKHLDKHLWTDSIGNAIKKYCQSSKDVRRFVPRDIRRTCKTLMGEIGISKETRDRLQNHALNDVSSKHYDRYEYLPEKRQALEAWENKLNQIHVDNVLEMKVAK